MATGDDDSTVKLRPCRRSQLTQGWVSEEDGDGWRLRVEEDWAGARRVLAASCVSDLPEGCNAAVRDGTAPVRRLFGEGQHRFLSECAGIRIDLDALTLLPAVAATRWEDVRVGDVDEVVVERWTLDALDFLELSIRKKSVEKARPHSGSWNGSSPPVTSNATTTPSRPSGCCGTSSGWTRTTVLASQDHIDASDELVTDPGRRVPVRPGDQPRD